jgi:hypothetical protein
MEAVHATAREDVARLAGALAEAIGSGWNATVEPGRLSSGAATFTFN